MPGPLVRRCAFAAAFLVASGLFLGCGAPASPQAATGAPAVSARGAASAQAHGAPSVTVSTGSTQAGAGGGAPVATSADTAGAPSAASSAPAAAQRYSTEVLTSDGSVFIRGLEGHARHSHGGAPAHLGSARFAVENRGSRTRVLHLDGIEFLSGAPCKGAALEVRSRPTAVGLMLENTAQTTHTREVRLAAGASATLEVAFAPVDAYEVWCEVFAFRVAVHADYEAVSAVAETRVVRVTPL